MYAIVLNLLPWLINSFLHFHRSERPPQPQACHMRTAAHSGATILFIHTWLNPCLYRTVLNTAHGGVASPPLLATWDGATDYITFKLASMELWPIVVQSTKVLYEIYVLQYGLLFCYPRLP